MSGGSLDYAYQCVDRAMVAMRQNTPLRTAFASHLALVSKALHDIEWVDSLDYAPGDEDAAIRNCLGLQSSDLSLDQHVRQLTERVKKIEEVTARFATSPADVETVAVHERLKRIEAAWYERFNEHVNGVPKAEPEHTTTAGCLMHMLRAVRDGKGGLYCWYCGRDSTGLEVGDAWKNMEAANLPPISFVPSPHDTLIVDQPTNYQPGVAEKMKAGLKNRVCMPCWTRGLSTCEHDSNPPDTPSAPPRKTRGDEVAEGMVGRIDNTHLCVGPFTTCDGYLFEVPAQDLRLAMSTITKLFAATIDAEIERRDKQWQEAFKKAADAAPLAAVVDVPWPAEISDQWKSAVEAAEREACATVCNDFFGKSNGAASKIRERIRARGKEST